MAAVRVVRNSERHLRKIDVAELVLRRPDVSAISSAVSVEPDHLGAALISHTAAAPTPKAADTAFHLFVYRCRGARTIRTDRGTAFHGRIGSQGMSIFVPAQEESHYQCEGPHETLHFYLGDRYLRNLASEAFGVDGDRVCFREAAFVHDEYGARLGQAAESRLVGQTPITALELDAWAHQFGLHVLRRYSNFGCRMVEPSSERLTPSALFSVLEYMQSSLDAPLRLVDIAGVVGMSAYRFAHAFRKAAGTSPHQCLMRMRVSRAQELLESSNLSLGSIAITVGFVDQSHFTNVFRKAVGITPLRYRLSRG